MRFHPAMLRAREIRDANVINLQIPINRPATPDIVRRRNSIAQTRNLIEARQREIDLQLRMLQAEQRNLQLAWDETCAEWERVWAKGME